MSRDGLPWEGTFREENEDGNELVIPLCLARRLNVGKESTLRKHLLCARHGAGLIDFHRLSLPRPLWRDTR